MLICFIEYFFEVFQTLIYLYNIAEGHMFPQILQNLIYLSRSSWYKLLAPFPIESISYKRDCDCDAMKDNCTVNDVDDGENVPSIRSRIYHCGGDCDCIDKYDDYRIFLFYFFYFIVYSYDDEAAPVW